MWNYKKHSGNRYEHRIVAEQAIGKALPDGAEVHHVNGNGLDNRPENLVICNNRAEHKSIHYRHRALIASGDANNVRCVYCKEWGSPDTMYVRRRRRAGIEARHRPCHSGYELNRKRAKMH